MKNVHLTITGHFNLRNYHFYNLTCITYLTYDINENYDRSFYRQIISWIKCNNKLKVKFSFDILIITSYSYSFFAVSKTTYFWFWQVWSEMQKKLKHVKWEWCETKFSVLQQTNQPLYTDNTFFRLILK